MESIEFIFSEIGEARINAGDSKDYLNSLNRLDPCLSTILKFFPNAQVKVYCDFDYKDDRVSTVNIKRVFSESQHRSGYRNSDYYKYKGLLESKADIAIAVDTDLVFCDPKCVVIIEFIKKFGSVCAPNPRSLVINDCYGGKNDGDWKEDGTYGLGRCLNHVPFGFYTKNERYRSLLEEYCDNFLKEPVRGPLALWKAIWKTGIHPYVLASEWCVCRRDVEPIPVSQPMILHCGHSQVLNKFSNKINSL